MWLLKFKTNTEIICFNYYMKKTPFDFQCHIVVIVVQSAAVCEVLEYRGTHKK